jgi:FtsP/CotA-like multicopper oxidase with cupredoxin domain
LSVGSDVNTVNGKAWPYLKVEPRTYRLMMIDASASRDYSIKFLAENAAGAQAWVVSASSLD